MYAKVFLDFPLIGPRNSYQKSLCDVDQGMDLCHRECTGHICPHLLSSQKCSVTRFSYFNCLVAFVSEETVMCRASHSHADPGSAPQTVLKMLLKCPYVFWVTAASASACILHRGFENCLLSLDFVELIHSGNSVH